VFSFLSPLLSSVVGPELPMTGSIYITAFGRDFSTSSRSPALMLDGTIAARSDWVSDSSVLSKLSSSSATSSIVLVTVDIQSSIPSVSVFVRPSLVSSIKPNFVPSTASILVSVFGQGHSFSSRMKQGFSSSSISIWVGDSSIVSKVLSGASSFHSICVSNSLRLSTLTRSFSYGIPTATGANPANSAKAGGIIVSVFGAGFGVSDTSPKLKFTFTTSNPSYWTSDSSLTGKAPAGNEASVTLRTSVLLLVGRTTRVFTFNAPVISTVS